MSIEFNCPYCSAMVRVPDNAGGKMGRCPKCTTRIRVPKATPAAKKGTPSDEPEEKIALPDDFVDPEVDAPTESEPAPVAESPVSDDLFALPAETASENDPFALPAFSPAAPVTSAASTRPTALPKPPKGKGRKAKGSRSISAGMLLLICLAVFLAVGGGIGLMLNMSGPQLTGTLQAVLIESPRIPTLPVDRRHSPLSGEEYDEFLKKLPNLTSISETQIGPTRVKFVNHPQGLAITCEGAQGSALYRIDPRSSETFARFYTDHLTDLEKPRLQELNQHGGDPYRLAYFQIMKKQPGQFRSADIADVGLAQLTNGLGYSVVAKVAGKEYRCCYQDELGLYFFLPGKVPEFELAGRHSPGGAPMISAGFKVQISKQPATMPAPPASATPPEKEDAKGMSDRSKKSPPKEEKKKEDMDSMKPPE